MIINTEKKKILTVMSPGHSDELSGAAEQPLIFVFQLCVVATQNRNNDICLHIFPV